MVILSHPTLHALKLNRILKTVVPQNLETAKNSSSGFCFLMLLNFCVKLYVKTARAQNTFLIAIFKSYSATRILYKKPICKIT